MQVYWNFMRMRMFKLLIKYSQEAKLTEENKEPTILNEEENKGGKEYVPRDKFNETNAALKEANENLAKIGIDAENAKLAKLEKDGELQTVIDQQKATIESLQPIADEYDKYKSNRKKELLSKLPEDKREAFEDTSITVLENVVAMQNKAVDIEQDDLQGRKQAPYKNLGEVATAFQTGKIDMETYKKESAKFKTQKGMFDYN